MMISTRGRYALRVMVDLAQHADSEFVAMKEVAERQQVSLKYLERILPLLVEKKLVEGVRGKGGGYRLTREPDEYTVGEILRAAEGDLAPVACLENDPQGCDRRNGCPTLFIWQELDRRIEDYLNSVTLQDILDRQTASFDYMI